MSLLPDQIARDQALGTESILVQAPAGSGKTTLLAMRFIRLLSMVNHPQEILAITFTRKAAAEMRQRVLAMLQEDTPASEAVRAKSLERRWDIFRNPNTLRIQTIDSFALELASQTQNQDTLAGMGIVEDASRSYNVATRRLLQQLIEQQETAPLIAEFLAFLDNDAQAAQRLVATMLSKRDQWLDLTSAISTNLDTADDNLHQILALTTTNLVAQTREAVVALLEPQDMAFFDRVADDQEDRFSGIAKLLTKAGTLRKRLTVKEAMGDAETARAMTQWLRSLHDRALAPPLERLAHLPDISAPSLSKDLVTVSVVLTLAAAELRALFDEQKQVDFVELLLAARRSLRDENDAPTDLALVLDYRIKHLLIDEYQDTSRTQFEFFKLLCEPWSEASGDTFFAVGDPMQSIYRFRNADVGIFSETGRSGIHSLHPTRLSLTANFRSTPAVVDWCNETFATLFAADHHTVSHSPAVPVLAGQGEVTCRFYEHEADEHHAIVSRIRALLAHDPDADIAILCRARGHIAGLLDALRANQIEWQAADIDPLNQVPVVRDLHTSLRFLINQEDQLARAALMRSPMFGFSLKALTGHIQPRQTPSIEHANDQRAARFELAMTWADKRLYQISIREVLEGFWQRLGGNAVYGESDWLQTQAYFELVETYGRGLVDVEDLEHRLLSLFAPDDKQTNVRIMTIHKAKGLEFDHVFVPCLNNTTRPDNPALIALEQSESGLLMGVKGDPIHTWISHENRAKNSAEETRLLYVAFTRARTNLAISWTQTPKSKPQGLARQLAAFAEDASCIAGFETPRLTGNPLDAQRDLFADQMQKRLPMAFQVSHGADDRPAQTRLESLASRPTVATGILVHEALAWLALKQPPGSNDEIHSILQDRMALWCTSLQLRPSDLQTIQKTALSQIEHFRLSEVGRWALTPHLQHVAEFGLSGVIRGNIQNIIIDRMFVDEGVRWILDYKSTQLHEDEPREALISRYRAQLRLYESVCAELYKEPIRCALVLTDTCEMLPIEATVF